MEQELKSLEVYGTVCNGKFTLAPKWLDVGVTSGITLAGPLVVEYDEIGKYYDHFGAVNAPYAHVTPQRIAFCRQPFDAAGQPCFGVSLYTGITMIFDTDRGAQRLYQGS